MRHSSVGVQTSAGVHPQTKELFQMIPMHMMNRVRRCPLQTVTIADTLISSVKVLAALAWLKQIDLASHWLV